MAHTSTGGMLLIATPAIGDGIFDQSVIYMLHHDPVGALGVVISDPSELGIDELLPRWTELAADPPVIFTGGPVEPNGFIGVGRSIETGEVVTIDLDGDPVLTAAEIDRLRIYRGYAGWAPQQLDSELAAGAWFTVTSHDGDIWSNDSETLYERVLKRQSGDIRWFANAPHDPTVN